MKKFGSLILLGLVSLFLHGRAEAFSPIRYVQISTNSLTQQTGGFNVSSGTLTNVYATSATVTNVYAQNGSASFPAYAFLNSIQSGIFSPAANILAWAISGAETMRMTSTGVSIGTTTVSYPLTVFRNANNWVMNVINQDTHGPAILMQQSTTTIGGIGQTGIWQNDTSGDMFIGAGSGKGVAVYTNNSSSKSAFWDTDGSLRQNGPLKFNTSVEPSSGCVLTSNGSGNAPKWTSLGRVVQVQMYTTATASATTVATFVPSNLTGTITPTSTSSKIVVLITGGILDSSLTGTCSATIARNGTNLLSSFGGAAFNTGTINLQAPLALNYYDSPATTSSTTYALYFKTDTAGQSCQVTPSNTTSVMILAEIQQ